MVIVPVDGLGCVTVMVYVPPGTTPPSLLVKVPVVVTLDVVVITSGLATKVGNTVKVMVVVEHGGELKLHKVYVAVVVPVKPGAGV